VLEEFMLEAGSTKGRDLRLGVRRIRLGASRDRHGDVVWLDFMAPHRHLVIDVTVTSARTNTNVPRVGARLPLPGSLALGLFGSSTKQTRCGPPHFRFAWHDFGSFGP
jgi:hypothetical protein